jgi:hypothetical protein
MDFWKETSFVVTDAPGAPPPGVTSASPAGDFRMTRDEMDGTRRKAEALLRKIVDQQAPAVRLTNMRSPADEPVSNGATKTLNDAGQYYVGHLKRQQAYLEVMIDKMRKALDMVSLAEETNRKAVQDAGGGSLG